MADPSNEPASSSGVSEQVAATTAAAAHAVPIREDLDKPEDFPEPDKKRRKTTNGRSENDAKTEQKLEHRLGGILCCAVCLDLPRAAVYQVSRPPPSSTLRRDHRVPLTTTTTSTWTSSSSFFLEKILFSSIEARRS